MHARLVVSHLLTALIAGGLGWSIHQTQDESMQLAREAKSDPVAAFTDVLRIEDPLVRARALSDFFVHADPSWAPMLRAEVNQDDGGLVLDEMGETLFSAWWSRANPEAAFSNRVTPGWTDRHPWLREVMLEWLRQNPIRAAEAVATLPPALEAGRFEATRVLMDGWFKLDPVPDTTPLVALLRPLDLMPRSAAIRRMLEASVEARGLDATEQFVESFPREDTIGVDIQDEMMKRMTAVLVDFDVDRALRWAAKHGEGREGSGILLHLAYYWGHKDGPAAMKWAMGLPEIREKRTIVKRAWISFFQSQPDASVKWLQDYEPEGPLKPIYVFTVGPVAYKNPKQAIALAEKATDPALRQQLLYAVGQAYLAADPKAATEWLPSSGLPQQTQDQLRAKAAEMPVLEPPKPAAS